MEYRINGGKKLSGSVSVSGAKNASLKLIIAGLMTEGRTVIHNVPHIRDVEALIEIINYLGGKAEFTARNSVSVENRLEKDRIPLEIAGKTRVSFMLIAPLLMTFGRAVVPNPGGCRLGARPVDRLVSIIRELGAEVTYSSDDGYYYAKLRRTDKREIVFRKKTHTGTELALMFAANLPRTTRIINAALEPEVDDLIKFLNQAGADVKRVGEDIVVSGKERLKGNEINVQSDRNEAISFIVLSALFGGAFEVRNVDTDNIKSFLKAFEKANFSYSYERRVRTFKVKSGSSINPVDVVTEPHPGFMTDWQPIWGLLMTQANGVSTIHETVFEDRFGYVAELKKFGAKLSLYSPRVEDPTKVYQFNWDGQNEKKQGLKITGPSRLHNAYAMMTDIRAGACLVLAALTAKGTSVITGAEQVERGYEDFVGKVKALGADISKVDIE